jgi:hypothetical protein
MNGVVLADVGTDAVSALEDFYTKIQALKYDTLVAENPVKETAEPMATFTYTKKDDTTCEVSFYPVDDDTLAVYIDGTYAYFTISTKNFTARDGVYDMYDQLLSAAGIE